MGVFLQCILFINELGVTGRGIQSGKSRKRFYLELATTIDQWSLLFWVFFPPAASLICLLCQSAALSLFVHSGLFLSMKLASPNLMNMIIFAQQYRCSGMDD